jgi:hypothetical protein
VNLLGEPLNYGCEVEDPLQPLDPYVEGYVIGLLKSLETKRLQPPRKTCAPNVMPGLFIVLELVVI